MARERQEELGAVGHKQSPELRLSLGVTLSNQLLRSLSICVLSDKIIIMIFGDEIRLCSRKFL